LSRTSHIERHSFSKIGSQIPLPDLLNLQVDSWSDFIQKEIAPHARENKGLEAIFRSVFPVEDSHGNYRLDYQSYSIGLPKYGIEECLDRGVTYSVPLKVKLILHATEEGADPGDYTVHVEQDIFLRFVGPEEQDLMLHFLVIHVSQHAHEGGNSDPSFDPLDPRTHQVREKDEDKGGRRAQTGFLKGPRRAGRGQKGDRGLSPAMFFKHFRHPVPCHEKGSPRCELRPLFLLPSLSQSVYFSR